MKLVKNHLIIDIANSLCRIMAFIGAAMIAFFVLFSAGCVSFWFIIAGKS